LKFKESFTKYRPRVVLPSALVFPYGLLINNNTHRELSFLPSALVFPDGLLIISNITPRAVLLSFPLVFPDGFLINKIRAASCPSFLPAALVFPDGHTTNKQTDRQTNPRLPSLRSIVHNFVCSSINDSYPQKDTRLLSASPDSRPAQFKSKQHAISMASCSAIYGGNKDQEKTKVAPRRTQTHREKREKKERERARCRSLMNKHEKQTRRNLDR